MHFSITVVCLALVACTSAGYADDSERLKDLERKVEQLSRQLMLQQLFVEERIRSDGTSGLKQTRVTKQGTRPYHGQTVTGFRVAAIHEHSNHIRTVGMGEFVAVLNGLEFRTRHNDYKVTKVATINHGKGQERIDYNGYDDIPFPDVPPEVTNAGSVENQIKEMREWFKAWKDQDYSVRDYRKYFKPTLCYLEGAWTISASDKIDESFPSDRHFIDASSWLDLQEKVRFTSYTGRKDSNENYAYLPTTIIHVEDGNATMAQWNYRIMCHPLNRDLSTNRLNLIDDITSRIAYGRTMKSHEESRAARFRVAPIDKDRWTERILIHDLLDELMSEIPGRDGYGNTLDDPGMDGRPAMKLKEQKKLNAGYYHRWFKAGKDAMGSQNQHRGFADETLFMAKTTQNKIAPMKVERCTGKGKTKVCTTLQQKWTYAIPLEMIYLTPLQSWNPYNIKYKGKRGSPEGQTVAADGRNGRSEAAAFNGTNNVMYYQTPIAFFKPLKDSGDKADTSGKAMWVLGGDGKAYQTTASGVRIHLPEIDGVGKLRMRYPIMPLHYEGSAAWKELTALKHVILEPNRYRNMFYKHEPNPDEPEMVTLELRTSLKANVEPHEHFFEVPLADLREMAANRTSMTVTTDEGLGHSHELKFIINKAGRPQYVMCDGLAGSCWDKHPVGMIIRDN